MGSLVELTIPSLTANGTTNYRSHAMRRNSGIRAEEKTQSKSEPGTLFEDACIRCQDGIESRL
jgi:hypothetical protein